MDLVIACGCGLDPATEGFLAQSVVAAAISGPFIFRTQVTGAIRRARRRLAGEAERVEVSSCDAEAADAADHG